MIERIVPSSTHSFLIRGSIVIGSTFILAESIDAEVRNYWRHASLCLMFILFKVACGYLSRGVR